jgi:hypothetical protein
VKKAIPGLFGDFLSHLSKKKVSWNCWNKSSSYGVEFLSYELGSSGVQSRLQLKKSKLWPISQSDSDVVTSIPTMLNLWSTCWWFCVISPPLAGVTKDNFMRRAPPRKECLNWRAVIEEFVKTMISVCSRNSWLLSRMGIIRLTTMQKESHRNHISWQAKNANKQIHRVNYSILPSWKMIREYQ